MNKIFSITIVRILNYEINNSLLHLWKICNQLPELFLCNNSNCTIAHALNAIYWVAIEHHLYLSDERAFLEVAEVYPLAPVDVLEDLAEAGAGYD